MSTHNIGFYEDLTKITFQLSLNTHMISSSDTYSRQRGGHKVFSPLENVDAPPWVAKPFC